VRAPVDVEHLPRRRVGDDHAERQLVEQAREERVRPLRAVTRLVLGGEGARGGPSERRRAEPSEHEHADRHHDQQRDRTGQVFESHAAPIRDATGTIAAAVVAFAEVTDRQRAELDRERFLDVLAHDLRNPIGAILMAAGALVQPPGMPERGQRAAARMQSSADRMKRLIEQLLEFARSRSGEMQLAIDAVDLAHIVRESVADVELGCPHCDFRVDAARS
jgi:signal transduction histidine kinase